MKKKSLFILYVVFLGFSLFANDTFFSLSGGNLVPVTDENTLIEMKEEVITLNFTSNYYEVTVDFTFVNTGNTKELTIGFPFFAPGNLGSGTIFDFECWTNGEKTSYTDKPISRSWDYENQPKLENAYTRNITFEKNEITTTKIKYKSTYSSNINIEKNGLSHAFWDGYYLYGTGSSWKNSIGKIRLVIINNLPYGYLGKIRMGENIWGKSIKEKLSKVNENTYEVIFTDIEPNYTDIFYIQFENILNDSGPKSFPSYFPFTKQITNHDELIWYTKEQLRIIRNTIYALHGYQFKSEDLKRFFELVGKNWYPPYSERIKNGFSESDLSEIEKENINIILNEEQIR